MLYWGLGAYGEAADERPDSGGLRPLRHYRLVCDAAGRFHCPLAHRVI